MTESNSKPILTNQVDDVLQGYLDQLLVTATEVDIAPVEVKVEAKIEDKIEVKAEPKIEVKTEAEIIVAPVSEPEIIVPEAVITTELDIIPQQVIDAMPESTVKSPTLAELNWQSNQGIECLIFKVAGLKLAMPLAWLGGVFHVEDRITPLFGQKSWSLGVWQSEGEKLTIVDSAEFIMPERNVSLRDKGYSFFIQLDRSPWALACQEICDTVTLVQDSIKWRGDKSSRPWLAGTVITEMCALVDVPGVLTMLEDSRS